jgi:Tol biopolymer transport system component
MKHMNSGTVIVLLLSSALMVTAPMGAQGRADAVEVMLEAAKKKEVVDGDLNGAIAQYQQVLDRHGRNRSVAATVMLRMADCYRKLGDSQAKKLYERVLREYTDQKQAVSIARARLGPGSPVKTTGVAMRQVWTGTGVDPSGSPSPDGRYLSFTDWETGDLAVRDLSNGTSHRLTNTGGWGASGDYASKSVISPDGRFVAYSWFLENAMKNELRVLPVGDTSGAKPRTVFRSEGSRDYAEPFGWSPDGKRLLIVRNLPDRASQIAMMTVATGSIQAIKSFGWNQPSPALSPDGRYIAYEAPAEDKPEDRDIFILAADGSADTPAVRTPAVDRYPAWSPDGSRLLFLSTRTGTYSLWTVPVDSGKPAGEARLVKGDVGPVTLLGMTRRGSLFYALPGSQHRNIYFADLDSDGKAASAAKLATDRLVNSSSGPAWSRDGELFAWYSSAAAGTVRLCIRNMKTGQEREVPVKVPVMHLFLAGPKWFPDNKSLLILAAEGKRRLFYRLDTSTGETQLLHSTNNSSLSSFDLSPDGKTIYYCVQNDQISNNMNGQVIRFDIGSDQPKILAQNRWFIAVSVSPDGSQLAVLESADRNAGNSERPNGSFISVLPTSGADSPRGIHGRETWMDGSRYNTLGWSPDSKYVLFVTGSVAQNAGNIIWRVPVAGGAAEQIGVSMPARIKSPSIHPDGKKLVFATMNSDSGEIWVLENFEAQQTSRL